MRTAQFQLAEEIFHDALSRPPEAQDLFVDQACGGDAELAERVRRMIGYARSGSSTIAMQLKGDASCALAGPERLLDKHIGRYRLTKVIGEGGFGVVYEAQQEHPVRRSVALKILRSGIDSSQVIARFAAERQVLAMMDHPNIARVLDAGQTEDELGSRPYFVMELVPGEPITTFCDRQRLSVQQRLSLVITVCHAVQHAHQKGIIHRDLKPTNILVSDIDGAAAPKIIDFGIAKAIHQPLVDHPAVTQQRELLGTPQYMSPEQAGWSDRGIDTRTDIYSLGVIMYELLTGSTPIEPKVFASASVDQMRSLLVAQASERPSVRLTRVRQIAAEDVATRRQSDARSLCSRLRGDLDWIVLKAIDGDRDRRYASAAALADDIRRHLDDQPVLAGPPSAAYRLRKFFRRHRVGAAAAAIVSIAILGGIGGVISGMLQARRAAEEALAVNEFMREVLTSANPEQLGADVRLVDVLEDASSRAGVQFANHPQLEAEVRELLGTVYAKLSQFDQAIVETRRAVELRLQHGGPGHRTTLTAQILQARVLNSLHHPKELESLVADLLPRVRREFGERHRHVALLETLEGRVHLNRGRVDQAEHRFAETMMWVTENFAVDDEVRLEVLRGMLDVLLTQFRALDPNTEQAAHMLERTHRVAVELYEMEMKRSGECSTATLVAQGRLAGILLEQGEYEQAIEHCYSALERSEGRLSECHDIRTDAIWRLASALRLQGRCVEAANLWIQRISCLRAMMPSNKILLCMNLSDALPYLEFGGRWREGEAIAREVRDGFAGLGDAHGPLTFNPEIYVARYLTLQDRLEEARPIFERWLNEESRLTEDHNRARLHLFHAGFLIKQQRFEEAEAELDQCRSILPRSRGTWDSHPDDICLEYITLYGAWGKPDKAEEYRRLREQYLAGPVQALTKFE